MSELLEFLNRAKTTNETISGLFECVSVADALRNKARISEEKNQQHIEDAMDYLYKDFKKRASIIKTEINRMKEENDAYLNRYGFDRGFVARNNFMQNLAKRLSLVIQDFGKVQGGFVVTQKERLREQYLIAIPNATDEEIVALDEKGKSKLLLQSAFTLGSKTEKEALLIAEKRRNTIENILESISDLKDLSDDFSDILRTDACEMDRVNLGMVYAKTNANNAHKIINKSARRKINIRKAKKAGTLLLLFLSVTTMFFLLLKLTR